MEIRRNRKFAFVIAILVMLIMIAISIICFSNNKVEAYMGYDITYDMNGATEETAPVDDNTYWGDATLMDVPTLTDSNLKFMGWALDSTGTGTIYQPGDTYTLDSCITFYAVWNYEYKEITYTKELKSVIDNTTSEYIFLDTGNYFLLSDIFLTKTIYISPNATVNLLFNGHIISGENFTGSVIFLQDKATLNVDDNKETPHKYDRVNNDTTHEMYKLVLNETSGTETINGGGIISGTSKYGGAIYGYGGSTIVINNGNFLGNEATGNGICCGGAIYTSSHATLTINDGYFSGNQAIAIDDVVSGAAICAFGKLTINKADIYKNNMWANHYNSSYYGGIIGSQSDTIIGSDVNITYNKATFTDAGRGGILGIHTYSTTGNQINISGNISNNDVVSNDALRGGIMLLEGSVTVDGLKANNNKYVCAETIFGGVLCVTGDSSSTSATIKNIEIKDNVNCQGKTSYGTLIFSDIYTLNIEGTNTISGNSYAAAGYIYGAIYSENDLCISGLTFDSNTLSITNGSKTLFGFICKGSAVTTNSSYIKDTIIKNNITNGTNTRYAGGIISDVSSKGNEFLIDNCEITGNKINSDGATNNNAVTGGLIYLVNPVKITNSKINDNIIKNTNNINGGLISSAGLTLTNTEIKNNVVSASNDFIEGGIINTSNGMTIDSTTFEGNDIYANYIGRALKGGIIYVSNTTSGVDTIIKNNTVFKSNKVKGLVNGGIIFTNLINATIEDTIFDSNEISLVGTYITAKGGLIYASFHDGQYDDEKLSLSGIIMNNIITGAEKSYYYGGLVYCGDYNLKDIEIYENSITSNNINGGVLYLEKVGVIDNATIRENVINVESSYGGIIDYIASNGEIKNSNIYSNTININSDSTVIVMGALVYSYSENPLTISKTNIYDNITSDVGLGKAKVYSNIYIKNAVIEDASIYGNEINGVTIGFGAGLCSYNYDSYVITLKGKVIIKDNTCNGEDSNWSITYDGDEIAGGTISGNLTNGSEIHVNLYTPCSDNICIKIVSNGAKAFNSGYFKIDNDRWYLLTKGNDLYYSGRILEEPTANNNYTYKIYEESDIGTTFTYQWYKKLTSGDEELVGNTISTLDRSDIVFGSFNCVVTSSANYTFRSSSATVKPTIIQQPSVSNSYTVIPDLTNVDKTGTNVTYAWYKYAETEYKLDIVTDSIAQGANCTIESIPVNATYDQATKSWKGTSGKLFGVDIQMSEGDTLYYKTNNYSTYSDYLSDGQMLYVSSSHSLDDALSAINFIGDSVLGFVAPSDGTYTLLLIGQSDDGFIPYDITLYISHVNGEFSANKVTSADAFTYMGISVGSTYDQSTHTYIKGEEDVFGFILDLEKDEAVSFEVLDDNIVNGTIYILDDPSSQETMYQIYGVPSGFIAPKEGRYYFLIALYDENGEPVSEALKINTSGGESTEIVSGQTNNYLSGVDDGKYICKVTYTQGDESVTISSNEVNYESAPKKYHVTYDLSGIDGSLIDSNTYNNGAKAKILGLPSDITKDGYTFDGWKDALGNRYTVGEKVTITSNLKLYAIWTNNDETEDQDIVTKVVNNEDITDEEISNLHVEMIEGSLDSNIIVVLTNTESEDQEQIIESIRKVLFSNSTLVGTFDLHLEKDGIKIENIEGNRYAITITLPKEYVGNSDIRVVSLDDDLNATVHNGELSEDGTKFSFETDHFSNWALCARDNSTNPSEPTKSHSHVPHIIMLLIAILILVVSFLKELKKNAMIILGIVLAILVAISIIILTKGCIMCTITVLALIAIFATYIIKALLIKK